jgi:hypothetical protein
MPRLTPFKLAVVCALALSLSLTLAVGAVAKGFSANLRVVGSGGKVLTEEAVKTGTAKVKTSPKANCFGSGSGGSGKTVSLATNTAMGLLVHASTSTGSLRPLLISDHFDFGLSLCGIGKSVAKGKSSWYLKVNHKALSVGGDSAKIKPGDEVLWDLAPSYPYPNELALEAPLSATANVPFTVYVVSYDEKGKRKPVAGATVSGAAGPTGPDGSATVTLSSSGSLSATHGKEIPSPAVDVCVGGPAVTCPAG